MTNWKINSLQLSLLLVFPIVSLIFGTGVYITIKHAYIDAYIAVAITGILGFIFLLLCLYIANYQPNLPINEKIISLFGKKIGTLFNIILRLIFLMMGIVMLYSVSNFTVSQFLSQTPLIVLNIAFCIAIIFNVSKGLQTISRCAVIIFAINMFLFITSSIGLIPHYDLNNIKPVLEFGITPPLKASIMLLLINILPMFLILIIPKNNIIDSKNYNKALIIGYIISIILCFLVILFTLLVLGIYLSQSLEYPEYIVLKKVTILGFLDRVENFVSIQWILGKFITLSLIVYFITSGIKKKADKPHIIPNIITSLLIILGSTFIFRNNTIFNNFIDSYYLYFPATLLFFYFIISLTITVKKNNQNT